MLDDWRRDAPFALPSALQAPPWSDRALERAVHLTQGQPWLVNALARQVVDVVVPDPSVAVTRAHVDEAKGILPSVLAQGSQDSLPSIHPTWLTPGGTLERQYAIASGRTDLCLYY